MSVDNNIDFKDHIVEYPNRFKMTTVSPGIVELVPTWIETPGQIIQDGTPVNEDLFEKLRNNVTCYSQTYTATEGQTNFSVSHPYNIGQSRISVYVGGVKQRTIVDFTEASSTSFILNVGLPAGTKVEAVTISFVQPLASDVQQQIDSILEQYGFNAERIEWLSNTLSDKADKNYVDNVTQILASGSPKGVYPSLPALAAAFPNGNGNTYVTSNNGKWNFWNGVSWIAGGDYQTSVVQNATNATNVIQNGNFANVSGWDAVSSSNGTLAVLNNELIYTVVGLVSSSRIQQSGIYTPIVGHKYYVRGDIYPNVANTSYISFGGVDSSIAPIPNAWNKISRVVTPINTTSFRYYHPTNNGYSAGDTVKFRRMLVVDLTATYGAGNEPDISEFENVLGNLANSWFESTTQIKPAVYLTQTLLNSKVDKINGKGLSTNDFTDSDKEILRTIANKKIINVSEFANLRLAMAAAVYPSADNRYELRINEGTYDLMTMYSQAEIENTSFVGFTIPNYVSLIGTGRKEATIIKMEIPETWQLSTIQRVAPVAYQGNGGMQNITVIGRNCRYTVHDDYGYPDAEKTIKNCTFKKLAGLGNSQAWGEGSFSGMKFYFEDVEFITEYGQAPYSTHNNLNFEKPSYHRFKNCKFINSGGYFGIRFITLASGVVDKVDMEGCYIDGIIKCEEYQPGDGCLFDIHMYGCSEVPILIDATNGSQPVYMINEETKIAKNFETTTITKGTPVMFNNDGSVILRLGSNDVSLMVGVALQDIPSQEKGTIKTKGYFPVIDTSLTLVKGDKVGVVNGVLAKVTNGDYIGVVTRNGFIKLKL